MGESVAMRHTASGRTMRASRAAFDREYSAQGWEVVGTAPSPDTSQPEAESTGSDELEASTEAPAKGRRARSK